MQPRPVPTGVISGVVTSADTGSPVRRVNVTLQSFVVGPGRPFDPYGERSVITDDAGRFEFAGVAGGRWRITATRAGYLTQQYGQRRPFEGAPPVALPGGERLTIAMALARAGAINGRIFDEYGEPLSGARIQLFRPRMAKQLRYLQPVGEGDLTDDTGAYRLHGLAPGEYYVAASLRVAPIDSVIQTTYAPTYYPGTGNFAEAQKIFVGTSAEVQADFPVRPLRTARITGFVVDSAGAPASAFLNLASEAAELGDSNGVGAATRDDGSFLLADVPPGTYTLYASLRNGGLDGEATAQPLTVYEEDIAGITLVTAKPASMRVTIVPDAGVTRVMPTSVDVVARSTRAGNETKHGTAGRVSSLPMTVPPGPFRIDPEIPEGWALKALIVGTVDMIDTPVDLEGREDVPVRLVLTDRITTVSGNVSRPRDDRVAAVVVFPEDSARWSQPARFIRAGLVDQRGNFRVAGLPGGQRYLAVAVEGLEDGEAEDPDFLVGMRDRAVSFPLAEGEQLVLGLAVEERR